MLSPHEYYNRQKQSYTGLLDKVITKSNRVSTLRLVTAVAAIITGIWAFRSHISYVGWGAGGFSVVFLILVRVHFDLAERRKRLELCLLMLENELKALTGDHRSFADGSRYIDISHPYSYDLDVFGKGSVYQMLCRATTRGGAALLADKLAYLLKTKEGVEQRQDIIKELSVLPDFLLSYRVAGAFEEEGANDQVLLQQWLGADDQFINNGVIRIAAIVIPLISIALLAGSIIAGDILPGAGLIIIFNWVLLGIYQKKIKPAIQQVGNSEQYIEKLANLLKEIAASDHKTKWLQDNVTVAKNSLKSITKFRELVKLFDSRDNVFLGPVLNSFFLFDLYCLLRLETWRRKNKNELLMAIDAVIAMDVYVSCSTYAFNHPENIYPNITAPGGSIHTVGLKHPLLPAGVAVGNDANLGKKEQFYLLTGANMTGKSTFIRTIGVTNILCNMGVPLPAEELSMPLLDLYTSMRITDSVQDDVSYFRAELNRIKMIMETVRSTTHKYLVLLDEPLRGTNSTDKQQGTRAIVENLLTYHAIGIVATHDTGLCDMEQHHTGKVSNYHFESKVETSGLSFDFKLKSGGSTSNNATILMKQMGIIN